MTTTTADARQDLADLEARILAGDRTVTADQLTAARAAVDLADLHHQADTRAAADAEHVRIEAARAELRSTAFATVDGHLAAVRADYSAVVEALRRLRLTVTGYQASLRAARASARRLGIADEIADRPEGFIDRIVEFAVNEGLGHPKTTRHNTVRRVVRYWFMTDEHEARANARLGS